MLSFINDFIFFIIIAFFIYASLNFRIFTVFKGSPPGRRKRRVIHVEQPKDL